jgi:hypothetical protein
VTKKEIIHRFGRDCGLTRGQASRTLRSIARSLGSRGGRGERSHPAGLASLLAAWSAKRGAKPARRRPRAHTRRARLTPARVLRPKT